uniref:Uncharacterized protein n=1 Tax=Siphoviridae sp. ctJ3t72 TaxID=2826240 RepID=A0A8S5QPR3_9CAUD|nr:MAG TPA: hypothetical protein [Siphoviridae sp. ctJ3t72]
MVTQSPNSASGVFALDEYYSSQYTSGGTGFRGVVSIDASRSNNIYTDSGKVYPLSLALNFIIKS